MARFPNAPQLMSVAGAAGLYSANIFASNVGPSTSNQEAPGERLSAGDINESAVHAPRVPYPSHYCAAVSVASSMNQNNKL